ncbi:MAG TPA: hypothetical protein VKZ60_15020 [Chloroflexota bacterium]|nr:hypothetical protein [Chloroflexota bacterium]
MRPRFWTRLGVGMAAGALVALTAAPATSHARDLEQFLPYPVCAVSGGGLTGAGNAVGQSQILSFGAGGFYGPYYSPVFGSVGLGTIGGFLNFTGGLPFCTSPFGAVQYTSAPFVLSSLGPTPGTLTPWPALPWGPWYGPGIGIVIR